MLIKILDKLKKTKLPPPNKAERLQYRAIKKAIETERCLMIINPDSFNKKYSPVYNVMENFIPLLIMIVLSLAIMLASNIIVGLVMILLSVLLYILFFKPWAENMLIHRVSSLMLQNYYNFQYLWNFGEVTLLLAKQKNIGCKSPKGDWKGFASLHFTDLMTMVSLASAPALPQLPKPTEPELENPEKSEDMLFDEDEFNIDDLDLS